MSKFRVCFTERIIKTIIVEAKSAEEAEKMVEDGDLDVDYSVAQEDDSEIVCINNTEKI
jgi:hypothetical protein